MVTIRSPCCGYNLAWFVELKGEDSWSCSHKIESVTFLLKRPYDHWLANKAYLSAITVTSTFLSFTYKMAEKPAGIDTERNYATVTLCIRWIAFGKQPDLAATGTHIYTICVHTELAATRQR